jgi:hypothetical protein
VHDALIRFLEPVRGLRSIVLVTVLAVGTASLVTNGQDTPAPRPLPTYEPVHCIEAAQPAEPPVVADLEVITLEHRWLVGSFASPAEVDAALGTTIAAWEPFTYMFDSQPRQAIASDIYPSTALRDPVFGRDEYGGIWLLRNETRAARATNILTYTRDIYLLPVGSSFRGVR